MAFDSTDYFRTEPAKVYDKDNPPARMSEAIRMAVADVDAQEAAGIEYEWADCTRCTAGAVVRQLGGDSWFCFGPKWNGIFGVLSTITMGWAEWEGQTIQSLFGFDCDRQSRLEDWAASEFSMPEASVHLVITPYYQDPAAFKRDMLNLADRLEAEGS